MAEGPFQRLRRFLAELKRRNVYKVAATYAVVAFVTLQAARLIFPATTLEGVYEVLVVIAFVGFPLSLVVAWAFEMTPEGVRRTKQAEPVEPGASKETGRLSTGYKVLVGLGLVAAAVAGGWYLTGGSGDSPEISDRSVAVLPFEALGQDEPGTFTEGMHSDLQTKLSNIAGLTVTSSRSVERYRGSAESTAAVAQELGVGWIVTGDVQRMGDQIQVNVRLVDPEADAQAWTESYRRDLTAENLFAIQTDITGEVAQALEAELSPGEAERVERQPTEDLDAYRLYVRGRKLLAQRTIESIREARGYFERALQQDSTYALAWAGLADAQVLTSIYDELSEDRRRALTDKAMESARRARKLDPELAEAWTALGAIHIWEQRRGWEEGRGPVALQELRRAVALKPSYAHAQQWLAELYLWLGRPERGLEHASLAVELAPEHAAARQNLIWALVANDREEEIWSHFQKYSGSARTVLKFFALYHTGRWDDLEALARKQLKEDGRGVWHFSLARIETLRGDTAAAREQLAWFRENEDHFGQGVVHAALGETDEAFSAWAKREEWGGLLQQIVRYWHPDILDPLREDPGHRKLIRKFNRQWGLNPDGSLPDSVDVSFESDD